MPEAVPAPARRRRRWPWIVAAVLLVAFLLRGPLLAPLVTRVVAGQIANAIDGQARIDAASGGWFGDAHLSGLSAEASSGPLRSLDIRSVQATYGLGIIKGELSALRTLRIGGVAATIDLRGGGTAWNGVVPPVLEWLPRPLPHVICTGEIRLLLPDGEVRLSDLRLTLSGDDVSLDVRVQVADAAVQHVVATFKRHAADSLRLERAVVLGDATLDTLELVLGSAQQRLTGSLHLGGGRLSLHADPANARVVAENLDLAAIPPALMALLPSGPGALRGSLAGEVTALRSPQGWQVAGSARLQDLVVAGAGPFTLAGQWQLAEDAINLRHLTVDGPRMGRATIDGLVWSFNDGRARAGTIRATLPDVRGWVPVSVWLPDEQVTLTTEVVVEGDVLAIRSARLVGAGVDLTVVGSVAMAPWRLEAADVAARLDLATIAGVVPGAPNLAGVLRVRASGTLPFTSDPVAWLTLPSQVQVRGDGLMVSAVALDQVRLDAHTGEGRVQVTHADATIAGIGVACTGEATWQDTTWRGTLATLALRLPGMEAAASAPCPVLIAGERWSVGPLRLTSVAGALNLEVRHQPGGGLLVVDAPQLDLGRIGVDGLAGTATIGVDLRGDWIAPSGNIRLLSDDLRVGTRHARLDVQVAQDQHGLAFTSGRIDAGDDGLITLGGTLPLRVGITGATLVADDGQPASIVAVISDLSRWLPQFDAGSAQCDVHLGAPQDAHPLSGRLVFSGVRPRPLAVAAGVLRSADISVFAGAVDLHGSADGMALTAAIQADDQPVLTGSLRSAGAWDAALWAGAWRERAITGDFALAGLRLTRLAALLPGVQHLAGTATGTVTVAGSVSAPQWRGTLAMKDVEAKLATDVPTFAEGVVQVELDGRTVHLRQGGFTLGGAPVTMTGDLTLDDPPILALRLDGRNALLVQRHDVRLRADLGLSLAGPLDQVVVSGQAVVTSALFSPDLSLWQGGGRSVDGRLVPFEFFTPPMSTLRFDMQVRSAFTSAQDGVRVATGLVRADCDLDLHLRGSGAAPELSGRVVVRQGQVFLPFSTLRLSTGEIRFPDGDPFRPLLNAVATAQVRRWRVTLQVDGPLADPQIRASGDGLDERDALLLLTTGSTSAELSGEEGQRVALGRLGTWLGRETWDLLDGEADPDAAPGMIDRLTLEFGRQVSEGGRDTIEAQVELTEPDINPGLLLFGERDRWDDYNAGVILRFRWGGEE